MRTSNINGLLILACLCACWLGTLANEDASFWKNMAKSDLQKLLENRPNTNIAKNVILMVGDGMGLSTVMATRVLKGQLKGQTGEETVLEFENFPYLGLAKVYSTNKQVPDSAATATAFLTGVKTKSKVIGMDESVTVGVCTNNSRAKVSSMLKWSQNAGKSAGIVTNTRVTHATPAAAYAHTPHRDWERSFDVPESQEDCLDIASQLIMENDIQVILGGGRKQFRTVSVRDPETGLYSLNLLQAWKDKKIKRNITHAIVTNSGELAAVDTDKIDSLIGLFSNSHMSYELERDKTPRGQPSLADMTEKAIQVLQKNEKGFFLLVEGGRIDHAHHANKAKKALFDTLAFEDAVKVATELTDDNDTLIIVTADHSHVMTVAGYPDRGNGILDLVHENGILSSGSDGLPYTTLSYGNGESYTYFRRDLSLVDTTANDYQQISTLPMDSETHSGEDVPIYSRGPMAHLLTGVIEQNVIAYVMAHAACVGDTGLQCRQGRLSTGQDQNHIKSADTSKSLVLQNTTNSPSNDVFRVHHNKILILITFLYLFLC